ncbi:MAG TPA: bifunctional UDP-N-acetylglucosamine diphosphorylase/glucosamine-1-phosphate N-acetyltransferase GlmU [Steroidobacteraceae bacterium]|jgi:bifunctional UDP-N-acetylglucosamine pyrophosphorylase/glucosamine-1-phosphate N-acetyltransferase|nr:bifunctional UDP-N-acetylglucosamine diphosphorylase/glucosamine-1-phosphate N-acetyltransferase GlmU [Steroidobacteraceae bacterium]
MPRKQPQAAQQATPTTTPLSIVILAAGQGKRMQSDIPKVLQPLAGAPMLAHVLDLAASLTPAAIHVVYGHGGERVRELFDDGRLRWSLQAEQLGTGDALQQAMPEIPDSHQVLVLYGDVPLLLADTVRGLVARSGPGRVALLTARLADAGGYGRVVRDARGKLRRIVEECDANAKQRRIQEVNTGVLVASARFLKAWLARLRPRNAQHEYYLTDIVSMAVRQKLRIETVQAGDAAEVQGVNDRQQLALAEGEYRRRRARQLMMQGVTLIDPARIDVRGSIVVGRDVLLDVNVVLDGPVVLGDGVRIGPNCVLKNVSVGARTVLFANCVLQDAQIGSDCQIGPFTRMRPKVRIADGVHLGNFVEIKNSEIGAGSKVNHLSYVGDSRVGRAVNVGAGSITCNYDGANKWRTEIGDRAFIGSGAMLVAPVKIGDGATIGAGSTITSDAPADKLTLARSRQITLEQWQRPRKNPSKS